MSPAECWLQPKYYGPRISEHLVHRLGIGTNMLTHLKLRQIIESGFLPLHCRCEINPNGSLVVTIIEPESGDVELCIQGIAISSLTSTEGVLKLIAELHAEMQLIHANNRISPA